MEQIEVGQRWTNKSDGLVVVVEGKSDLLIRWWKVRAADTGLSVSIDEDTLLGKYRPEPPAAAADEESQPKKLAGTAAA